MSVHFSSEGFDLDAATANEDVVFELGGGVSEVPREEEKKAATTTTLGDDNNDDDDPLIAKAEAFKSDGNEQFKAGAYLEACDMYTEAIEACPGMTGKELLKLKDEFDEQQRELASERYRQSESERRRRRSSTKEEGETVDEKPSAPPEIEKFVPPAHAHGGKLAIYHSNRAACLSHLKRYEDAISDCHVAILLNPRYTKAYLRRSTAYEATERMDDALADAKEALALDPTNIKTKKNVARLQKLEDERMEKLKAETFDKLKDLGNSILGNFGLSVDNFKAVQDPGTGSYSISFENTPGEKK
jgi:tetratricopeptide (TPR) repeat protein